MGSLLGGFLALSQQEDHELFAVGMQNRGFLLVFGLDAREVDT